jgi:hypothetical protein
MKLSKRDWNRLKKQDSLMGERRAVRLSGSHLRYLRLPRVRDVEQVQTKNDLDQSAKQAARDPRPPHKQRQTIIREHCAADSEVRGEK